MNNISIISINTIKPLTPTPIPQEARDSDLATNINLNIGGNISITETEERHEYQKTHDTWGGDIGMAALGGAMTGLAGGLGMGAGNMIGGTLSGLALSGASAFGSSNVGAVISENRKGTSNGTYTTNQIGSDIIALNDINITTDNNLNIVGSDLTSLNNTTLNSNNGSVNITTAVETQTTEQTKTKTNWGGIDFTHTNSSVGVGASIERNTTSSTATTQYAKSSNIQSGNNIAISSGNNNSNNSTDTNTKNNNQQQDINIIGSNILAENDIKLNANGDNGNIKIISQELLQNKLDKQKTEAITASVGITNYWAKTADQTHNLIDNSKGGARDSKEGYTNTFFDLGNIGISVMNAAGSPLGFGISADIGYNLIETETAQNNTYNQESSIVSNKGSIDLNAENDINIKGSVIATNGEDKEINLTSNNGDISILASKDTTNISSETNTNSVNIDLSLIPTYSYNNSDTTIEQTSYNNSIISANGNNSKINIESKNKDINIKGANIEADNDINLLAQNGNMNIESNQDRYYSNTDTKGFQIGGTIGFNLGKDYQEDITNNYTTIKSNNGNTNINTNDLALVGINEETKNNLNIQEQIANGNIKGNTTETQLQEKHDSEYYDLGVSYSLPVSIGNLNQKVNNALSNAFEKLANTLKDTDSTAGELLGAGITKLNTPPTTKDPLQPKTDSQSIINSGDWANSWKNTTVSYRDDNGFDFTASPNSVAMSGKITKKGIIYGSSGADYIFEQLYKLPGLKEGQFGRDVVGIVAAPFTVFGEQGSYLRNRDGKVRQEDIASAGTSYQVPGQTTGEKGAEYIINTLDNDSVVRVNPTDGGIGDTIKSGMMKILNITGLSDMVAMNRYVAKDKYIIATSENNTIRNMNFHSQGTIIDQGSNRVFLKEYPNTIMPTTNSLGEKINYNIQGYAIYPNITEGLYNKVSDNTINREADNLHMVRNPNDPIQQFAAPTLSSNPITFIINNFNSPNPIIIFDNLKKSFDSHSLDNQIYDNNRSVINIKKRIEINDKRGIPTKTDKNNGTKYIGLPDIK